MRVLDPRLTALILVAFMSLGLVSRAAAVPASKSKLKIEIDSTFHATLVLEGDDSLRDCTAEELTGHVAFHGTKRLETSAVALGARYLDDPASQAVASILKSGGGLKCSSGAGGAVAVDVPFSGVVALPPLADSPDPAFAPDLEWRGFDTEYGTALQSRLGNPTKCEYLPDGVSPSKQACAITPVNRSSGPHFTFQVSPTPTAGKILVTFEKAATKLRLPVVACTFKRTGPISFVVSGASRQLLFVTSDEPGCNDRLSGWGPDNVSLVADPVRLRGVASHVHGGVSIDLGAVGADLPVGSRDFEIRDAAEHAVGKVSIPIVQGITVSAGLDVHYTDQGLEAAQPGKSNDGVAVLDPFDAPGHAPEITNVASLTFPPELIADTSTSMLPAGAAPTQPPAVSADELCSTEDEVLWTGTSVTAGTTIVDESTNTFKQGTILRSGTHLAFRATTEATTPRLVRLKRWLVRREVRSTTPGVSRCKSGDPTLAESRRVDGSPLVEIDVKVAQSVKRKAIPLALNDLLDVRCDTKAIIGGVNQDVARNGALVSIAAGSMSQGRCTVSPLWPA